ncbi:hypothetical protein CR194_09095 [Salipaludibacillus keqinensis]|uniref:Transporter n=1 Tax=Salipaludibacillus keqinensis TaxID=2045207 RepID=A0A323TE11_9BACI|nr:AEC family transporter [Salipaludibacillus keqinensis]PYZ93338.1 hypothetical protein CR194_09095 [Salipaludibacillus keqinensis]
MNLITLLNPVLLLTTIAIAGFFISKRLVVTNHVKKFVSFIVINLALPGVVIQSVFNLVLDEQTWSLISTVFFMGFLLNIIGMLLGYGLTRAFNYSSFSSRQAAVLSGLGNTGFIGIPFLAIMLGGEAGAFAAFYDASSMMLVFSLGVMLLQPDKFKLYQMKSLFNMPFVTLLISVIMLSNDRSPINFVMDLSEILAGLSAPLAMIYIGLLIGEWDKKSFNLIKRDYSKFILVVVTTKVILLPFIALIILSFKDAPLIIKQVIIIQSGMPSFLLAIVLFENYKGNVQAAITVIIATVFLFLLVVPLIGYLSFYLL